MCEKLNSSSPKILLAVSNKNKYFKELAQCQLQQKKICLVAKKIEGKEKQKILSIVRLLNSINEMPHP